MARRWHWRPIQGSVVYILLVLFSSRCADVQEGNKVGDMARVPSSQSATSAQFELDVSGETIKPLSEAQWYCEESYIYEQPPNPSNVTPRPYDCSPPPPYEGPGVISKQCFSYQPGGDCGGCWLTGSHPPNGTEETCYYEYGVSTSNCTTTGSCTLEKLKTKWFPSTMDNTGAFTIDQRTCAEGSVQVFENFMNYAFINGVYVKVPDYIISRRTNQGDAFSPTVVNGGTRVCKNAYELCLNGFSVVSLPSKSFNLDCSGVGPTSTPTPTPTSTATATATATPTAPPTPEPCSSAGGLSLAAEQCTPTPTPTCGKTPLIDPRKPTSKFSPEGREFTKKYEGTGRWAYSDGGYACQYEEDLTPEQAKKRKCFLSSEAEGLPSIQKAITVGAFLDESNETDAASTQSFSVDAAAGESTAKSAAKEKPKTEKYICTSVKVGAFPTPTLTNRCQKAEKEGTLMAIEELGYCTVGIGHFLASRPCKRADNGYVTAESDPLFANCEEEYLGICESGAI